MTDQQIDEDRPRVRWGLAKKRADDLTKPYSSPPVPVLEIAERSGVDVIFADFAQFNDAVSGFCDFVGRRLYVNSNDATNRQKFTIAHELGHWLLHREYFEKNPDRYPVLPRFGVPDNRNPFEKEANFFAAHLLVPDRLLRPVSEAPISELAQVFGVSRQMMDHRVKNVGQ